MSASVTGLMAGLLLAVAIVAGGFTGFLLALVLGGIGYLVGAHVGGDFDVVDAIRGRRD